MSLRLSSVRQKLLTTLILHRQGAVVRLHHADTATSAPKLQVAQDVIQRATSPRRGLIPSLASRSGRLRRIIGRLQQPSSGLQHSKCWSGLRPRASTTYLGLFATSATREPPKMPRVSIRQRCMKCMQLLPSRSAALRKQLKPINTSAKRAQQATTARSGRRAARNGMNLSCPGMPLSRPEAPRAHSELRHRPNPSDEVLWTPRVYLLKRKTSRRLEVHR